MWNLRCFLQNCRSFPLFICFPTDLLVLSRSCNISPHHKFPGSEVMSPYISVSCKAFVDVFFSWPLPAYTCVPWSCFSSSLSNSALKTWINKFMTVERIELILKRKNEVHFSTRLTLLASVIYICIYNIHLFWYRLIKKALFPLFFCLLRKSIITVGRKLSGGGVSFLGWGGRE